MADARIEGADQLRDLARRLRAAGASDLRKELLAGIRSTTKPLQAEMLAHAGRVLPQRGGFGRTVAKAKLAARTKTSGREIGVRIIVDAPKGDPKLDMAKTDAGKLRHLTFGHKPWQNQKVAPGAFSAPFEAGAPRVQTAITEAMDHVAGRIEGS